MLQSATPEYPHLRGRCFHLSNAPSIAKGVRNSGLNGKRIGGPPEPEGLGLCLLVPHVSTAFALSERKKKNIKPGILCVVAGCGGENFVLLDPRAGVGGCMVLGFEHGSACRAWALSGPCHVCVVACVAQMFC